jgi:hypothetical protein
MKKVLLIVVDACTSRVLAPALESGRLPRLRELAQAGRLYLDCAAIFPSITPAATASIITGCYPFEHGIAGAYWYDTDKDRVVYFGDSLRVVLAEGVRRFFNDMLVRLNQEHLRAPTLFQLVEGAGLRAACLNYLIFRGDHRRQLRVPLLLSLWPGVPFAKEVQGPAITFLGDFCAEGLDVPDRELKARGGPFHRFGFDDDATAQVLIQLARDRALPDFTVAYFPDYDYRSHEVGPEQAVDKLENLDDRLGEFIAVCGGLERLLAGMCVMLTADHSQSDVRPGDEAGILLDQTLEEFEVAEAGKEWESDDQLMVCPNMRVAMIYFRRPSHEQIERVVDRLLTEARVDQVMWPAALARRSERGYHIVTRDRGELLFWPGEGGAQSAADAQGCVWSWDGDLRVVDGRVSEGRLSFPAYPNAFERIACALEHPDSGHLWVTSRPGFEFRLPHTNVHDGGGSHGSLDALDSTIPLLIAGAPEELSLPENARTVDVAPLCLRVLGLRPRREAGASHVCR